MNMKGDYKNNLGNKSALGKMPRTKKYGGGSMKKRMAYSKGGNAMPKAKPC